MRFFLSLLGVIIFVVIAIVLIASNGGGKNSSRAVNLDTYNYPGSSVTQTTTGELVADSQRETIRITVSQSEVSIYLLSGYNQNISKSETFANNLTAYGVFLGALQNANYTKSRNTSEVNMFGVCPLGNTFQYQLSSSTKTVTNLWSTSCSYSDGTFAGTGPLIRQLFSLQIPNYTPFTQQETFITNPTS